MATNMNNLRSEQLAILNKIIVAGQQLGASNIVIMAAVNIANAESDFTASRGNPNSTAFGLFQYTNTTWKEQWSAFANANLNNLLSNLSASTVRQNVDAMIQLMYFDLNKWYAGYDQGLINKMYSPGGADYWKVQVLQSAGIDVLNSFLEYAYLNHNTDPKQIINITNTVFTSENLAATQNLIFQQTNQEVQSFRDDTTYDGIISDDTISDEMAGDDSDDDDSDDDDSDDDDSDDDDSDDDDSDDDDSDDDDSDDDDSDDDVTNGDTTNNTSNGDTIGDGSDNSW